MAAIYDGYVRVSRVGARDKTDGFISPDIQEEAIRRKALDVGVDVHMHPPELNRSGGTMDRPIFNEIMGRIRAGESAGLIVYKTDRFARTLLGAVSTLVELGKHNASFVSASEAQLDYSTPAGKAFLHQMFVFHEFLRDTLKESWAVSQRFAIERGIHIGPNSKTGWLGYTPGDDRRLAPDDQAEIVVEVYHRAAAGETWQSLADLLNEVAPKPSGALWIGAAVKALLAKRIYRGEASRYVEQDKDGRGAIVNPDAHPALVSEEVWQAANAPRRAAYGGRRQGKPLPLLAGLIRCAGCRYRLSVGSGPKGQKMYRCRARHSSGQCPSPASVTASAIEEYVENAVLEEIDGITRAIPDSADRDEATAAQRRAREDLASFRADREARRKLGAEWHDWLDDYLAAVRTADAAVARLDAADGAITDGLTLDHYRALTVDERRAVLAGFIDVVFLRRSGGRGQHAIAVEQRTRILWAGQGPVDLPRQRVRNPIRSFDFEHEIETGLLPPKSST